MVPTMTDLDGFPPTFLEDSVARAADDAMEHVLKIDLYVSPAEQQLLTEEEIHELWIARQEES